ncbi:GNAT family N-acetyltransferase [Bhargavaea cecembensis]|uniref:GNAT family N-acetyltransferase n=1 Tax=Bhargavaea cecembensis TaxID=394098 RepID=UPI00058E593E|nr:GNAT family protein [Bhargavaea cecembensis]
MSYTENGTTIRPVHEEDLRRLWELSFRDKDPEWKRWDAPYYPHSTMTWEAFQEKRANLVGQDDFWVIERGGDVIGMVSWYWEHEPSRWLEMGIVIYEPQHWGGGIGTTALRMWNDHLFNTMPLVRTGYTTWSGNERMIRAGEKLGFKMEARLRKVRYWNGEYYDSIRMGMLREEWEELNREK